jgi:hypothetical protein
MKETTEKVASKTFLRRTFSKQIMLRIFQVAQQIAAKPNIHIGSLPSSVVLIQSQNYAYEFGRVVWPKHTAMTPQVTFATGQLKNK